MNNKKYPLLIGVLLMVCLLSILSVFAHPGRTDQYGGHWDRESGTYHFHSGEYAGKGSGGGASVSEYVPFTPPYEPPTDNPYRSNNDDDDTASSGSELNIMGIVGKIFFAIFCVWVAWALISSDFQQNDGCITFAVSVALIIYLICYLIEKNPLWILGIIVITIIVIPIIKRLKKKYSAVVADIDNYQNSFYRLDYYNEELPRAEMRIVQYKTFCIPDNYEIGKDNLPKDKEAVGYWGKSFTLYETDNGTKLHTKYNCCSAVNLTHIYRYRNYDNFSSNLCKKCAGNYVVPDMSWYDDYLNYKWAKEKRQDIDNNRDRLRKEIKDLHKKCNAIRTKALIMFSKTNRKALRETNKKYKEMLNTPSQSVVDIFLAESKAHINDNKH